MGLSLRDNAVSPVIGMILLVAITIVLVSMIATVVMGMSDEISRHRDVGILVSPAENGVVVTVFGGADAGDVRGFSVYADTTELKSDSISSVTVGRAYLFTGAVSGTVKVTVNGRFSDNTTKMLYHGSVTLR